jgi:hypothetical protein
LGHAAQQAGVVEAQLGEGADNIAHLGRREVARVGVRAGGLGQRHQHVRVARLAGGRAGGMGWEGGQ